MAQLKVGVFLIGPRFAHAASPSKPESFTLLIDDVLRAAVGDVRGHADRLVAHHDAVVGDRVDAQPVARA